MGATAMPASRDAADDAAEVEWQDGLRPRADQCGDLVGIEPERGVVDVAQHRRAPGGDDRLVIGDEIEGGGDHLVARADARGQEAEVEGGGPGVGGQGVAAVEAEEACDAFLEGLGDRAHPQPAGVQGVDNRLDRVHTDHGLEDRDRRRAGVSHRRTGGNRRAHT